MILNTSRTTLLSSAVSSLSTLKPLFSGDQRYHVSLQPLMPLLTSHLCHAEPFADQISGSEIAGAGTCVCGSSFAMTC